MTEETLPLAELLAKTGNGDFLRRVADAVVQLPMEADVDGMIGADHHQCTLDQASYRHGYRDRSLKIRQLGTRANCQSLVSLTLVRNEMAVMVRLRLSLSEGWSSDAERYAEAGVPDARMAT